MKISVAMATYNGGYLLKEQIESIVNQSKLVDEIIIIDDNSSDNTYEYLQKLKERYSDKYIDIKIFRNEFNLGVVKTFTKAINMSKGDFIFLADQDDIWEYAKVDICTSVMESNDKIKLLCTGYRIIDEKGQFLDNKKYPFNEDKIINFKSIISGNKFPGCSMVIRKEIKKYLEFINEDIYIHDWYLAIMASINNGLYYISNPLLKYRLHSNNTIGKNTRLKSRFSIEQRIESIRNNIKFYNSIIQIFENLNIIDNSKINYILELIKFQNKRYILLESRDNLKLFLHNIKYINNHKNIRNIIGDLWYVYKK